MDPTPNPGANPAARPPRGVISLPLLADTPILPGMATNCYLLQVDGGALVVDPPSRREEALGAILDAAPGEIRGILITHTHPDHIAGVPELAARTGAPVYAHPAAREHLPPALDLRPLEEGEEIAGWQVFYTPGHRADSLTFYAAGSQCAIVGDLVAGFGTVIINPPEGDLQEYLASLRRLREEIRPALLAPGHGPLVDEPERLLTYYIEHRLAREQQVLGALGEAPASLAELLPVAYADTPPALHPLAERSLLAHLLKLQREGRAREEAGRWRLAGG